MEGRRITREKRKDYYFILFGTFLAALSANLFFTPSKMVPGGFTGLAIIIRYVTQPVVKGGVPTWLSNTVLNIPLILGAIRIRGWKFMRRTFAASVLFSVWLAVIPEYRLLGEDLFLNTMAGGALMGAGLGFVFLGKATTGGTDTLSALLQRAFPHMSTAKLMQIVDGGVILLSAGIFGIPISAYAAISVVLTGYVADRITGGARNACLAYIISERYSEIAEEITHELNRGATILSGKGVYTNANHPVLMCAISKKQSVILREMVSEADPSAFMILTDANEVRGEGFLAYTREEL